MKKAFTVLLASFLFLPLWAQEDVEDLSDQNEVVEEIDDSNQQESTISASYKLGNGLRISTANGAHLNISGLVQTTAVMHQYEDVDKSYNRYRIRRARVRFDGNAYGDKLRFRVGLDLVKGSETDSDDGSLLQDAWIAYRPWGNNKLQISMGQRSTPTDNLELSMSSHTLQFVERSKITSYFSTIREVGVFVESSMRVSRDGYLRPSIAITDGDGPIGGKHVGGMKYGARLNYLPFGTFRNYGQSREEDMAYEFTPKLCVGAAVSYNEAVTDRRGGRSGDMYYYDERGRIVQPGMGKVVADAMFKYRGFSLLAEWAKTWAHIPYDKTTAHSSTAGVSSNFADPLGIDDKNVERFIQNRLMLGSGWNVQCSYLTRSMWSFGARYTHITPDEVSFMNNDLYFNRNDYADLNIGKYLNHDYSTKIQATLSWVKTAGECRTPDSINFSGNEWMASLMLQFKF